MNIQNLSPRICINIALLPVMLVMLFITPAISAPANKKLQKQVPITGECKTYLKPINELLKQCQVGPPKSLMLDIDKSSRLMRLKINGKTVKTYVIALGLNPDKKKDRRGDRATPEGKYYVCEKNPRSQFYLSLKLSYPNIEDARNGLAKGLIDQQTQQKIANAIRNRKAPPMNTKLGGNICIHSGGVGKLNWKGNPPFVNIRDWTAGCIALGKSEITELFKLIPLGTPVIIRA